MRPLTSAAALSRVAPVAPVAAAAAPPLPDLLGTHVPARAAVRCAGFAVVAAALALTVSGALPAAALVGVSGVVAVALVLRGRSPVLDQVLGACGVLASAVAVPGLVAGGGVSVVAAVSPVLALALAVRQFAVARSVRAVRSVLGLSVLVTVAAAGTAPSAALVGPVVLVWGSVLAGLACAVPHRPVDGRVVRRAAAGSVVASTVALVLFLLVPVPSSGGGALGGLGGLGGGAGGGGPVGAPVRSVQAYAGGTLDLSARGGLPATELLRVPAGSPSLWRSGVLDVYDGRTWVSSGNPVRWASAAAGYVAVPEPGASDVERVDDVEPLGSYPAVVSAGSPVGVRTSSELFDGASGLVLAQEGSSYRVVSRVVPSVDGPQDGSVPSVPGVAAVPQDVARWTQLPAGVPRRVRELGVRLAGGRDPVAAARAVSAHLRSVARYSLEAPVPAAGQDAVDAFVFQDRVGFCEQFATAEVVLLRSAGFPARLVTGFAGGESSGGARVFRSADAHAWVEVWVPGAGWVSSDPTAGAPLVGDGAGARGWWRGAWAQVQRLVERVLADAGARALVAVVLVVLLVAAVVVVRWWSRRWSRRGAPAVVVGPAGRRQDPAVGALLVAVARFDGALPPRWRRGAAEGVSDWRGRLVGAVQVCGPHASTEAAGDAGADAVAAAVAALEVVERACFGRVLPGRGELLGACGALEGASSVLLARQRGSAVRSGG
ncbi:transglutaminaseTgpA domain-containing protein [Kineococcus sp. TBRC 1896]|uniref:TransglutaminaseTgpA domain-containing protein n=1 Tax=Kineococcus mangrovi TaxID=1660183 RepID=A0ABV4I6V7_9ACTN